MEQKTINNDQVQTLNSISTLVHTNNVQAGWWTNLKYETHKKEVVDILSTILGPLQANEYAEEILKKTGITKEADRNVGELLCLVHSEISEAMEGYRKNLQDDKLPHRKMLEVELADTMIRIFDIAGKYNLDLGGAIKEKIEYNMKRGDHKIENRVKANGKSF